MISRVVCPFVFIISDHNYQLDGLLLIWVYDASSNSWIDCIAVRLLDRLHRICILMWISMHILIEPWEAKWQRSTEKSCAYLLYIHVNAVEQYKKKMPKKRYFSANQQQCIEKPTCCELAVLNNNLIIRLIAIWDRDKESEEKQS